MATDMHVMGAEAQVIAADTRQADLPAKRSLAQSVAWTAGAKWSGQLLTSGITLLVARILSPSDYGLVGMAVLFLGFVRFLSDFGIGGAVVARREYDEDRLAGLNSCAILLGLAGMIITIAAAEPLGHFFNQRQLPFVLVLTSVTFLVTGFRVLPTAILQRDLRFKLLAGVDLMQAVVGALITLVLAVAGAGYWALVVGNIAALTLACTIIVGVRPQRLGRLEPRLLRPAVKMSRDLTIANVCWYVYSNADFLVVGKVLGQAALGFYNIGWTLAMLIVERVTTIVGGVAPAYLSAASQDIAELRRYLLRISSGIALLTLPVSFGLALVADDFCTVVLGPKWAAAATPLRLLAVYAGVRSLTPIVPQILIVSGEHRFVANNAIFAAIVMPIAFWIGARWNVTGVALAWVIAFPIVTAPQFMKVFEVLEMTMTDYLRDLRLPLASSLVMAGLVLGVRFMAAGVSPPLRLALSVATGVCAYACMLYVVFGLRLGTIAGMLRTSRVAPA